MAHHHQRFHRLHQSRKPEEVDLECGKFPFYYKRSRPQLCLLFLSLICCAFIFLYLSHTLDVEHGGMFANLYLNASASSCSLISSGSFCCDRSSIRSDICFMKGDVRTHSASSSIFLFTSKYKNGFLDYVKRMTHINKGAGAEELRHEKIKPYTRKWETSVMATIDELDLILVKEKRKNSSNHSHRCDVWHDAQALFFSTGGYTGNVYHEFNDGIIPLYITSQHLNKKVVFVILDYHNWWVSKYGNIISQLSDYPPVDFYGDDRTHCFPGAIVGLMIHNELSVDPSLMEGSKSIRDFRDLIDRAYWPRINGLIQDEEREALLAKVALSPTSNSSLQAKADTVQEKILMKPTLAIISRNGSRGIANEDLIVKMAEEIGFQVKVLRPDRTTELAKIYRDLNSSDAMIGVHGAAMTHFLFLKPGSVFIQVVPLGTEWAAETYYGEPAVKYGLKYISYNILPRESSLFDKYDKNDPILRDPQSVAKKGWEFTKKIYLDDQSVRLDLRRFKKRLVDAYGHSISGNSSHFHLSHGLHGNN